MWPDKVVLPEPPFCDANTITRIDANMRPPDCSTALAAPRPIFNHGELKPHVEGASNCLQNLTRILWKEKTPEAA
jgi:hypothetical protein